MQSNFYDVVKSEILKTVKTCQIDASRTSTNVVTYGLKNTAGMVILQLTCDMDSGILTATINGRKMLTIANTDETAVEILNTIKQKLQEQKKFALLRQEIIATQEDNAALEFLRNNRV